MHGPVLGFGFRRPGGRFLCTRLVRGLEPVSRFRFSVFGFQVSGFRNWETFRFRVSGIGRFRVSGFGNQVSGVGFRVGG